MANYQIFQTPQISEEQLDSQKERRQILNYLALLDEKLRYMFQNLEPGENFSEAAFQNYIKTKEGLTSLQVTAGKISALVSDLEGNFSLMEQTVDQIQTTVANNKGDISQLTQRADAITARVSNAEGDISSLEQTAGKIETRVSSAEGNISTLTQTAKGLSTRVSSAEGNISSMKQTADKIETRVSSAEGNISTLTQTANGLSTRVSNAEGNISSVEQTADMINWVVRSGTSASNFTLTSRMAKLVAEEIDITGFVSFTDLEESGSTYINGDNIQTGRILSDFLALGGLMEVYKKRNSTTRVGGYIGYATGDDEINATTEGIAMAERNGENYFIATTGGVRMTADTNAFVVMYNRITATEEIAITSDARRKQEISYDMDKYEGFFRRLRPAYYQYKHGTSGRYHIGFLAQEVEKALEEGGITTQDFAGLVQKKDKDEESLEGEYPNQYYLRYENFIALNTYMIQRLMARVEELERRAAAWEERGL